MSTSRQAAMYQYAVYSSPLGPLTLVESDQGLSGIYFEQHRHFSGTGDWPRVRTSPVLDAVAGQLDEYFAGQRQHFEVKLAPQGTPFQRRVWDALRRLQYGTLTSYGELATELGDIRCARAVGAAVGRNPVSIIIPCHRVVAGNGALTGFAGGLDRKRYLLQAEAAQTGLSLS